jgi:enolase-phosphatase E1
VSQAIACRGVRGVVLDIEGTTTPLSFVTGTLFPYARAHAGDFLNRRGTDDGVRGDLALLRAERAADPAAKGIAEPGDHDLAYLHFLMDQDRKSTALKALQGRIWDEGFRAGTLRGEVYPDVPPAFRRWRAQGRRLAIFSSGSVLAQKLLFGSTAEGDLCPFLEAYFDTTTGPKKEPESYRRIAEALALGTSALLFLSDVAEELDAARAAGLGTALCVRQGEPPRTAHPVATTFDAVCP